MSKDIVNYRADNNNHVTTKIAFIARPQYVVRNIVMLILSVRLTFLIQHCIKTARRQPHHASFLTAKPYSNHVMRSYSTGALNMDVVMEGKICRLWYCLPPQPTRRTSWKLVANPGF